MSNLAESNKNIVNAFLRQVRAGKEPENARIFMNDNVIAHQLQSENSYSVIRTPFQYTEHVKEFIELYGNFTFEITELIAQEEKVYARWRQVGTLQKKIDNSGEIGNKIIEIASAVYRLENGKIAEYWIQVDRMGLHLQLIKNL